MEHEPSDSQSRAQSSDDGPPLRLTLSEDRSALTVVWPGAAPRVLLARVLRAHSRSSGAIRERLDGRAPDAAEDLRILAIDLVGSYAVNIVFSDGHDRGIYPWAYLREIAQASETSPEGKELLITPSGVGHPGGDGQDGLPSERSHANG